MYDSKSGDITHHIKRIAFGHNLESDYLIDVDYTTIKQLKEKCTYQLRDDSTLVGRLKRIKGSTSCKFVTLELSLLGDRQVELKGRLYGLPEELGVALDDVVDIQ
jgi:hypothetical protein